MPTVATRTRKLHLGHFAFMRAVVQGLDARQSWERCLKNEGDSTDVRVVRSTIAWMRDEFAAAARREDRFGTARLVLIDVSRLAEDAPKLPTLAEFASERGLDDFSEREQIAAFEDEFGKASQRLRRRERLIAKQLEALRWLEAHIAQPPRAGDSVAAWLNPAHAARIERAGIFTVAQLVDRVNGLGRRWYASIKALGESKAARITAWLREHEASLGMRVGDHVEHARGRLYAHELRAVVAPSSDIRPLEKFVVPAALDGSAGLYRRPQHQCLLEAANDYQAILAWLKSKQGLTPAQKEQLRSRRRERSSGIEQPMDWLRDLSNTQRAYRKEAERFLLWAVTERKKPLSSMNNEDCARYRDFLADPLPRSRWCGERARERWSPLWRPFEGPLAPSAQRQAITILKNLYGFLVDQNYLMGNPWSAVSVPRSGAPSINAGRSFTQAQWKFIQEQLARLPETSANRRLAFGLKLLYATGLRLSEVVAAKVDDLSWFEFPPDDTDGEALEGWMLRVIGKGQKLREVPVPVEVVSELSSYLQTRGLDPDPEHGSNRGAALLGKASDAAERAPGLATGKYDPLEGIAASTFHDHIKAFFADCADVRAALRDTRGAERFRKASTHWMRHSHASHAIAARMPVEIAQQNLGHASLATTTIYVTTEAKRRMKAVNGFWKGQG